MPRFIEKLDTAARRNHSLLCVGLDPWGPSLPIPDVAAFNRAIIEATGDCVCAFKPNIAFYEASGLEGMRALEQTIKAVPDGIPVILDAKRGDIGNTSAAYAKAAFEVWGADAVTVNPYGGGDSLAPFLAYQDKGVIIWCRSSNPGAADLQGRTLSGADGARLLYEAVAERANAWNVHGNVGLVVGATAHIELQRVRALCPDMPLLIPGIGAQGGDLDASVRSGVDRHGMHAIINSGRQVLYASRGAGYAQAARKAAMGLRDAINATRQAMGFRWS